MREQALFPPPPQKSLVTRLIEHFVLFLCISIAVAVFQGAFGQETGPLLLDDVKCTGRESSLLNCTHRKIGVTNCFYDVGVVCSHCKSCI